MLKVGPSSLLVATLGVAAPFALGWGVSAWILPEQGPYAHAFLGATLTATSVGITARVLKDLDRSKSNEARVILGAAVIDDLLGLVILAVVTGIITAANRGGSLAAGEIAFILIKAIGFLVGALVLGVLCARQCRACCTSTAAPSPRRYAEFEESFFLQVPRKGGTPAHPVP